MGTRTIGLDDEAYERLSAQKREGESFSDAVKRITETISSDWRRSFGKYADADGERLEATARESRNRSNAGLTDRQSRVFEALADDETTGDGSNAGADR